MSTDEKFIADARAHAQAQRAELERTLAADKSRRAGRLFGVRWLLHELFEGLAFTLMAFLVTSVMAVFALMITLGISFQASAILVGLGAVVLLGLWAALR